MNLKLSLCILLWARLAFQVSSASLPASSCTILDGTNICGDAYTGYPVLSSVFSDTKSFNAYFRANITEDTFVSSSFNKDFSCSSPVLTDSIKKTLRYQTSFYCSSIVTDAVIKGCAFVPTLPVNGPVLCDSKCQIAEASLRSLFTNTTSCPIVSTDAVMKRNAFLKSVSDQCRDFRIASSVCVSGQPIEIKNCGISSSIHCTYLTNV